nr:MAG TPA: hypothetical protein [Caudoviricetes sp.]
MVSTIFQAVELIVHATITLIISDYVVVGWDYGIVPAI